MLDHLTPETAERIRALCRKISVAHDLDEEIQAELFSHMEDKLLGYLSGEEKVTEEDALILVREHFGDPAVLKGLLRETHAVEFGISLLRKLGAVAAASLVAFIISQALWLPLLYLLPDRPAWIIDNQIVQLLLGWTYCLGPVLLILIILDIWRKTAATGKLQWFSTFSSRRFAAVLACLLSLTAILFLPWGKGQPEWEFLALQAASSKYIGIKALLFICQCMIWLWWIDTGPRRFRTMILGALAWAGFFFGLHILSEVGHFSEIFEHPSVYFLGVPAVAAVDAGIAAGLYLLARYLVSLRDRIVEVITR